MKIQLKIFLVASLIFVRLAVFAQEEESLEDLFKVDYDTPLTLDLEEEEEDVIAPVKKEKKVKRNVYFGLKTRKAFTRTIRGNDVILDLFNVLKEYVGPPEYASDFYWYDYKKKKIINSLRVDQRNAGVLHGPYEKRVGDQIIEQGWYYKGLKHRRWVRFNRHDILQDKAYWWKGWPQESRLAYYDFKKTKLREVIPVHYGERDGEYWAFHEDGSLAVRGEYKFGHKVGLWREYYDGGRVKREVVYPTDPFDFKFNPHITREWDPKGTLIYDRAKFLKGRLN
ncbi:toxin-antitoxin system YwqK family antitoxin [Ekhidna sp. To15]|uniref:toxin-antitoxin system YwqK family antitoxin n=1 Tax=Ekhidna sp. To15 TaxID=3395267 RepID=UPI003F528825